MYRKERRKRKREDERDAKFNGLVSSITEICSIMKRKLASLIMSRALKTTSDEDTKKKLEDKLIKIVLVLEV